MAVVTIDYGLKTEHDLAKQNFTKQADTFIPQMTDKDEDIFICKYIPPKSWPQCAP